MRGLDRKAHEMSLQRQFDSHEAFEYSCKYQHWIVAEWFCELNPFKYYIELSKWQVDDWKIVCNHEYNILILLYSFNYKGYTNSTDFVLGEGQNVELTLSCCKN